MTERKPKDDSTVPFFPDHITLEAKVALGFGILLFIIGAVALWYPVGLGEPADPMVTPEHAKPEWYFLFLYQMLKFVPKTFGATAPVVAVFLLMLWPFIDRKPDTTHKSERNRLIIAVVLLLLIGALSVWGEVS
ncbi:MAG: cytochrome b subunit of the bc complex [Anaerolineales bacterium]|uniref:Cytochrome b subunit of the bc complex n=1 Tax=Candidatus Desulfolinea nitratireducens TaxID=2841698 RepID=A0A8J6NL24_9CHLR|nr:cytochrome b subunit of the bc complex [Candidatus Desulfolinea nitratireducens]MBL6960844.1 cytochrome b subunit of the bc complex [Anaerolineales bacterium]